MIIIGGLPPNIPEEHLIPLCVNIFGETLNKFNENNPVTESTNIELHLAKFKEFVLEMEISDGLINLVKNHSTKSAEEVVQEAWEEFLAHAKEQFERFVKNPLRDLLNAMKAIKEMKDLMSNMEDSSKSIAREYCGDDLMNQCNEEFNATGKVSENKIRVVLRGLMKCIFDQIPNTTIKEKVTAFEEIVVQKDSKKQFKLLLSKSKIPEERHSAIITEETSVFISELFEV